MIIRTVTSVTAMLTEDWLVEPIPAEHVDELTRNPLAMFDYATTHGGQDWVGSPVAPVRISLEVQGEETDIIEDAYILQDPPEDELAYVDRDTLFAAIEGLPADGANKSRDAGRGYAQAIQDVLALLGANR